MTAALAAAIVGCGIIGVNHARAIARVDGIEVAALVDRDLVAAERLAELIVAEQAVPAPPIFGDLGDALAAGGIDVVVICTPSGLHVVLAEQAVAAGAHVVIEKPLDVTLPRARRILELAAQAESAGRVVSVISQHRFDPGSARVAQAAHDGSFGRITSAVASVAWWRSQAYYDSGQWRGTWALDGGGALMNQGVHTADLLIWFLGRPVEVFAQTALLAHERIEVEDTVVATVRFASGALAVLHATTAAYPSSAGGVRIQVHGTLGGAIVQDDQLEYFHVLDETDVADGSRSRNQAAEVVVASALRGAPPASDAFVVGHARQFADVVDAIRTGRRPGVTVEDAFISLALVRAVYASATLGRPVSFDAVLAGEHDELTPVVGAAGDVVHTAGAPA